MIFAGNSKTQTKSLNPAPTEALNLESYPKCQNHHVALFIKVFRFDERFHYKFLRAADAVPDFSTIAFHSNLYLMLQETLTWIQNLGSLGAIAFITLYIFAAVFFIPGTILTLGAGAVFGVVAGSVYVFAGATLGAIAAFLVGRYLARDRVARRIEGNEKFKAIGDAVAKEGLKIVILTRLSPVFPFTLLNYAFGVTRVTLKDFAIGCVGMIPGIVMYVYIGSLAGNLAMLGTTELSQEAQYAQWGIRIVGLIATVIVTVYITRIARKALQENALEQN